jgi:hypothetical protein
MKNLSQPEGGTQMPGDRSYKAGRSHGTGEEAKDDLLRGVGLLALPVLAFHRNMLGILRKGITEAGLLKPVQTLAENELHALLMIVDPSGKWRSSLSTDMEKKLKNTLDAGVPKMISGAVSLIDAQQAMLTTVIEALDAARSSKTSKK